MHGVANTFRVGVVNLCECNKTFFYLSTTKISDHNYTLCFIWHISCVITNETSCTNVSWMDEVVMLDPRRARSSPNTLKDSYRLISRRQRSRESNIYEYRSDFVTDWLVSTCLFITYDYRWSLPLGGICEYAFRCVIARQNHCCVKLYETIIVCEKGRTEDWCSNREDFRLLFHARVLATCEGSPDESLIH